MASQQIQQQEEQQCNIDPAYQQVVQDIIIDNTQSFGHKNKPRNQEPSMFQLLAWQPKEDEQWDFKSNNPAVLHSQGYQKYKARIARTEDPYYSEQRDQFRKYHHDKATGANLPEFDLDQLELLRQEQQQQQNQQQRGIPITEIQEQAQRRNQQEQWDLDQVQNKLAENQQRQGKKVQQGSPNRNAGVYYYKDQEEIEAEAAAAAQQAEIDQQLQEQELQDDAQNQEEAYHRPIPNTKNVKSKLLSYKKQAKKLDPVYEKERLDRRKERINHMKGTTRWMPNTAFTTYYGKPAFENYGMGNTKPTVGGLVYGQYMLSHNVNPHRGQKEPQHIQSHKNALDFGDRLPESEPQPPRNCKEEFRLSQKQVHDHMNRNPLTATKNNRENLKIVKPDLINSLRFASEENSPDNSVDEETKRKRILEQNKSFKRHSKAGSKKSPSQTASLAGGHQKSVQIQEPFEQEQLQQQQQEQQQQQQRPSQQQQQQQQPQQSNLKQQQQQRPVSATVKQQNRKQPQRQQQQQQQQQIDDNQSDRGYFMEELRRKKAQSNRLALKVTEVIPVPSNNNYVDTEEQDLQETRPAYVNDNFNEMEPPAGYLEQIQDYELNPQNYRNIPPQWMKRIPYAGKKLNQDIPFSINQK